MIISRDFIPNIVCHKRVQSFSASLFINLTLEKIHPRIPRVEFILAFPKERLVPYSRRSVSLFLHSSSRNYHTSLIQAMNRKSSTDKGAEFIRCWFSFFNSKGKVQHTSRKKERQIRHKVLHRETTSPTKEREREKVGNFSAFMCKSKGTLRYLAHFTLLLPESIEEDSSRMSWYFSFCRWWWSCRTTTLLLYLSSRTREEEKTNRSKGRTESKWQTITAVKMCAKKVRDEVKNQMTDSSRNDMQLRLDGGSWIFITEWLTTEGTILCENEMKLQNCVQSRWVRGRRSPCH